MTESETTKSANESNCLCFGKREKKLRPQDGQGTGPEHQDFSQRVDDHKEQVDYTDSNLFKLIKNGDYAEAELLFKDHKQLLEPVKHTDFKGQTVLHLAVCKRRRRLVRKIIEELDSELDKLETLLTAKATGTQFEGTAMLGQLPLSVAVLVFSKEIVQMLINAYLHCKEEGKMNTPHILTFRNNEGDNVLHSLIKYSYLYPSKEEKAYEMCTFLIQCIYDKTVGYKDSKRIILDENNEGYTPVTLAVRYGQAKLFHLIMSQKEYCQSSADDGCFDIKVYDVTDLNTYLPDEKDIKSDEKDCVPDKKDSRDEQKATITSKHHILASLHELQPEKAIDILTFPPVHRSANIKWAAYRIFFCVWFFVHILFMGCMTAYAVRRSHTYNSSENVNNTETLCFEHRLFDDAYVTTMCFIATVVSIVFISIEVRILYCGIIRLTFASLLNPHSNSVFRMMFFLMSLCLIVDMVMKIVDECYDNYLLMVAVLLGWYLCLFFLRTMRGLSFFPVVIQKSIVGDMIPFVLILSLQIIAFGTAIYMLLQGSDNVEEDNFSSYPRVLFSATGIIFGLVDPHDIYTTRRPILTAIISLSFVVIASTLLLNCLIAIISNTCNYLTSSAHTHFMHLKLQRLSVILFIESVIPKHWRKTVGEKHERTNRRMLKILSKRKTDLFESSVLNNEDEQSIDNKDAETIDAMMENLIEKTEDQSLVGNTDVTYKYVSSKPTLDIYHMSLAPRKSCSCRELVRTTYPPSVSD